MDRKAARSHRGHCWIGNGKACEIYIIITIIFKYMYGVSTFITEVLSAALSC